MRVSVFGKGVQKHFAHTPMHFYNQLFGEARILDFCFMLLLLRLHQVKVEHLLRTQQSQTQPTELYILFLLSLDSMSLKDFALSNCSYTCLLHWVAPWNAYTFYHDCLSI